VGLRLHYSPDPAALTSWQVDVKISEFVSK